MRLNPPWRQNSSFFVKWKTAASGLGRAAGCVEVVGKKGDGGSRRLLGKMCRYESRQLRPWSAPTRKKGDGCSGRLFGKLRPSECGH